MNLPWKEYKSYEKAKDCQDCLYIFRKDDVPLYIGRAKKFGGPDGRYAYGYRYLVEALLESGCRLYIAELSGAQAERRHDYERTLIENYREYLVNKRIQEPQARAKGLRLPWRVPAAAARSKPK